MRVQTEGTLPGPGLLIQPRTSTTSYQYDLVPVRPRTSTTSLEVKWSYLVLTRTGFIFFGRTRTQYDQVRPRTQYDLVRSSRT